MIRTLQGPITGVERAGLVIALALGAALMWPLRHHLTDTTFIHLHYARHLASGEGLVFNPGERVYGSVSPLWVSLLADGIALGLDGLTVARTLGFLATLASIGLFLQLMRRTLRMPALRAFATVGWASHPWMLQWSLSGTEIPLAVALVLAGFVAFTEGKEWGSRPVRTGASWGLAALTRPEAVFLLLLWIVLLLIDAQNRAGLRRLVFGILPAGLIYGAWLLFARVYFGTFWPQALSVDAGGSAGFSEQLARLAHQAGIAATTDGVLIVLLLLSLLFSARQLWRQRPIAQRLLPWFWVVSLPLLYAARGVEAQSRHLLLILPVVDWLAWNAAERWWIGPAPSERRPVQAAVLGVLVLALVVGQSLALVRAQVIPEVRSVTAKLEDGPIRWGRWFEKNARAGDAIVTGEIGAIGYYSRRRIVDLTGLVTPGMIEILSRESRADALANFRFEAFGRPRFLVEHPPHSMARARSTPYSTALAPLGRAGEYAFYRIEWERFDRLRASRD